MDDVHDKSKMQSEECTPLYFKCPMGGCIPLNALCDGFVNCKGGYDEWLCYSQQGTVILNKLPEIRYFNNYTFLPTLINDMGSLTILDKCDFKMTDNMDYMCVYNRHLKEKFKTDMCINKWNVESCEHYNCPYFYKCAQSYCIPVRMVCDGVKDCITGEDEVYCTNVLCVELLQCRGEFYCIPPWEICDGTVHCPLWEEDELYCHRCPAGCLCHGNAVYCDGLQESIRGQHQTQMCLHRHVKAISYNGGTTSNLQYDCSGKGIIFVKMQYGELISMPLTGTIFTDMSSLSVIYFSHNHIATIHQEQFQNHLFIKVIYL
jgi:hypothetical protein